MNLKVSDAKREEGFTLIELLVVVIIIGILAAIAIPIFLNQRERAWIRTAESDVRNAAIAIETVFTDDFEWPENFAGIDNAASPFDLQVDGADSGEEIVVSPLVVLTYFLADGGDNAGQQYCIHALHLNVDDTEPQATYHSTQGGLQDEAEVCDQAYANS